MEFLKSAVASAIAKGPLAAYNVAEKVELDNTIWTLNNATRRVCSESARNEKLDLTSNP